MKDWRQSECHKIVSLDGRAWELKEWSRSFSEIFCRFTEPQPSYSAFREASFGHGMLEIKNRTHAFFGWHRNEDGYAVEADSVWLRNRYWSSLKEPSRYKDCLTLNLNDPVAVS